MMTWVWSPGPQKGRQRADWLHRVALWPPVACKIGTDKENCMKLKCFFTSKGTVEGRDSAFREWERTFASQRPELVSFLIAEGKKKLFRKSQLREERFTLSCYSRMESSGAGKPWLQVQEATGHIVALARMERKMNVAAPFIFSLFPFVLIWDSDPRGCHPHRGWGFLSQFNLSGNTLPHRHVWHRRVS